LDTPVLKKLLSPLASLKLTVVLIVLAMLLIYAGTWAQVDHGIWHVQKKYFHSFFTWVSLQTLLPRPRAGQAGIPSFIGFPLPGGYVLGLALLINLIAAHALRFRATWRDLMLIPAFAASVALAYFFPPKDNFSLVILLLLAPLPILAACWPLHGKRTGVIAIHLGLILLLVGEGITSANAIESQMVIHEGDTARWSQDIRSAELAVIDPSPADHDAVVAVPASHLKTGATLTDARLPVQVHVEQYMPNSAVLGPMQAAKANMNAAVKATAGTGVGITAVPQSQVSGAGGDADKVDYPSAYLTLKSRDGQQVIGTYLVSALPIEMPGRPALDVAQEFAVDGKPYRVQLRFVRHYKPYAITLIDFRHDTYLGTDTPKDYSSYVRLTEPARNVDREVRIWMNNPLRYQGETFYQASFVGSDTTVLQIVSNPGWMLPYLACAIGAYGLALHFGITLRKFVHKNAVTREAAPAGDLPLRGRSPVRASPIPGWLSTATLASIAFVLFVYAMTLAGTVRPVGKESSYDLATFGDLPISYEGRIQPLDTLARNTLKILGGRESAVTKELKAGEREPDAEADRPERLSAIRWLADMFAQPEKAGDYPVIRIDHPQVIGLLNLEEGRKRFSFREILQQREKLQEQLDRAHAARRDNPKSLDLFQTKLIELGSKLQTYMTVGQMADLYLIPPLASGEKWQPIGRALPDPNNAANAHPAAKAYLDIITAYSQQDAPAFNRAVASYRQTVEEKLPRDERKAEFEALFNRFDPFMQCMILYVVALVMVSLSWVFDRIGPALRRGAIAATLIALVIHTAGLIARIYISGRPPVTNLPASAIFIAWACVVFAVGVEFFYRNGLALIGGAVIGFCSLVIADRLSVANPEFADTMKVLQAVLDTNFWLATHVVAITLGYSATFLAGVLGIAYVIGGVFTKSLTRDGSKDLVRMIYGITCFAVLFSFVGTVLGGIWADQSWGRFWGWDPKENGAVLIVLANALLLHARWGGMAKERGIACLAIFGNIITSWSWFGTNMLGVGLHSYGFMDSALSWLLLFVFSQVALIVAANIPLTWWRSYERLFAPVPKQIPARALPSPM
jgi:ABC-type transport system involved in cytochrome c biogenesis permease subunit